MINASIAPGDPIGPVTLEVTHALAKEFTIISKDTNSSHYDDAVAQKLGFPAAIQHSGILGSLMFRMLADWKGSVLQHDDEFECTFIAPIFLGDTPTVRGVVTDVSDAVVACDFWCEKQDGTKAIVGKARVRRA
jgi:acyl dehydratase